MSDGPPAAPTLRSTLQWRVGAVVVLALAVLLAALVVTGPLRVLSGQKLALDYGYIGPLKPGAAVRLAGMVVGSVEDVELLAGLHESAGPDVMVRVHVRLDEKALPVVTDRARYYVTTLGVLGEHYVDIEPGRGGQPLPDGAVVRGVDLARTDLLLPRAAALLELLRELLDEGRPEALELLRRVGDVLRRLDRLLDPGEGTALADEAKAALTDAREVLAGLRVFVGDGEELRAALGEARGVLWEGAQVSRELREAEVGALLREGRVALGKVDTTVDKLNDSLVTDGRRQRELAHTFEKTFWELEELSTTATKLLIALERGEGAMGKAFQDEQLIDDLKAVLRQLRKNPAGLLFPRVGPPRPDDGKQ